MLLPFLFSLSFMLSCAIIRKRAISCPILTVEMDTMHINKYHLMVAGAAVLWGCIGPFVKYLSGQGFSSLQIVAIRVTVAAVLFTLFLLIRSPHLLRIRLRHCGYFIGTGILSLAFFNFCYFEAIRRSSIATAVILLYTAPIFVLLFSSVLFQETLTRAKLAAVILTVTGCSLVSGIGGEMGLTPAALALGLCSGLGYALYSIFSKYALRHYSSATISAYTFLFAAIAMLPLCQPAQLLPQLASPSTLLPALGLGLLSCIIPYLLYTKGLEHTEAGQASIIATLEPVVGCLFGLVVYQEHVDWMQGIGILLVLGAIVLINFSQHSAAPLQQQSKTS